MEYIWAFLIGGLLCLVGQILMDGTTLTTPRVLVIFVVLGVVLEGFALFVLLVAVIPCWCMGTVLTVLLAMSKHDKPKWLWAVSLGLAVAFGLIAAGTLAAWILI